MLTNTSLKILDKQNLKRPLKEFDINIKSNRTEIRNCLGDFDKYINKIKFKYMTKELVIICDASKIRNLNYTIILISDFHNSASFNLLHIDISNTVTNTACLIRIIKDSLTTISKGLPSLRLVITDAASYNLAAYKQLYPNYPYMRW